MFKHIAIAGVRVDDAAAHHQMISGYFDCRKDPAALDAGTALSDSFEASPILQTFLNAYGCDTAEDRAVLAHYDYLHGREDFRELVIEKLNLTDACADQVVVTASVKAAQWHLSHLPERVQSQVVVYSLTVGRHEFGVSVCHTSASAQPLSEEALFSPPATLSQVAAMRSDSPWKLTPVNDYVAKDLSAHPFKGDISTFFAKRHRPDVLPSQITVFSGTTTALRALGYAFSGQKIGVINPIYAGYDGDFKASHPEGVSYFNGADKAGDFKPEVLFQWATENDVKVLVVNNPNNPTGHLLSESDVQNICSLAKEKNIDVVFDEINLDSGNRNTDTASALKFSAANIHVHVVNGVAKTLGFAGFKVGWVISENKAVNQELQKQELRYHPSVSTLDSLHTDLFKKITIKDLDGMMAAIYQRRESQYKSFTHWLSKNDIEFIENNAEGLTVMVNLGSTLDAGQTQSDIELANTLFSERKVFVMPGKSAHFKDSGWFRISYAHDGFVDRFKPILSPHSKL